MGDDGGCSYDAGCSSDYGNTSSYDTDSHTAVCESRDDSHGNSHGGFFSPVVEESSYLCPAETTERRKEEDVREGGEIVDATVDVISAAFSPNENGELPISLLLDDDTKRTMETTFGPISDDSHDPSCGEDCCYLSVLCCECSIL